MNQLKIQCKLDSVDSIFFKKQNKSIIVTIDAQKFDEKFKHTYKVTLVEFLGWGLGAQMLADRPSGSLVLGNRAELSFKYSPVYLETHLSFLLTDNTGSDVKSFYFNEKSRQETIHWLQGLLVTETKLDVDGPVFGLGS